VNLFYTPASVDDLRRLRNFIGVKNQEAAYKISVELREGISILTDLPRIGHKVMKSQTPDLIRDLFVNRYIVRYCILPNEIHVLRIWHQREDWSSE
jgi:plasmid stabilization system protein ParE